MKRMMTNALAIAAAASWVTVAAAQSQMGQQQGSTRTDDEKSMKYTGCLQQGDTPGTFKLTNVQPADSSRSGSSTGTSGSASGSTSGSASGTSGMGSSSSMMSEREFTLVPSGSNVDLQEHVGKRVEITAKSLESDRSSSSSSASGTSGTSGTSGSGSSTSGSTGAGQAQGHSMEHAKRVQVTAVRAIGGSCSDR